MFNFSRFTKGGDRPINDGVRKAEDGDKPKNDTRFKPGPQTKETRRGDGAFDTAKGHIDDAADAARVGDQEAATYHLTMAHQYANLGVQNHMMSDFYGKTKALAKKTETEK